MSASAAKFHPQKLVTFLVGRLSEPVDGAWLAALRFLFGGIMCVSMLRFILYGWITRFFVEPRVHFKYWGFEWVQPLDEAGLYALFYALVALAFCVSIGLFYRLSAVTFTVGLTYFQLIDVSTYLNHYYLASLLSLLLALSPAGKLYSVDQFVRRRLWKKSESSSSVARFWLWLFRYQVGIVYVCAGLAKLNADWLVHAQPLRIWLGARTDLPLLGPLFTLEGVPLAMSWAGFLYDTTIVGWLSFRKTRPFAYGIVLVFHTLTRLLFPIGMFPVIMSVAALVFFSPSWPRWLLSQAAKIGTKTPLTDTNHDATCAPRKMAPAPRGARLALVSTLAGVYCLTQLVLPLRGLLYGGNVMWHEQGMRFSWRVMLRAKGGSATFTVREPGTGRVAHVAPRRYLTDLQEAEMVSQPDLILQLAHVIEHDYERQGWKNVQVNVDSRVSLNGRRSQVFIDPHADLAREKIDLRPLSWVTESPQVSPHHTRPVL